MIGLPKETKPLEGRIALVPSDCVKLVASGNMVLMEQGAGLLSGFSDDDYRHAGVAVCADAAELYARADMIVKVKEPTAHDLQYLGAQHTLFCFLHLAALPQLTQKLCDIGLTAIAFECVEVNKQLPLLAPMSQIAGKIAVQVGSHLLHSSMAGKGVLLGGVRGAEGGRVVVIGAGQAGLEAANTAYALGAELIVIDQKKQALQTVHEMMPKALTFMASADIIAEHLKTADLVIGAVLVKGGTAPLVITEAMVRSMPAGSVFVDIAIDQGGCAETSHATHYLEPTFVVHDVTHMCVTNLPGSVAHTASEALSGVLWPYVIELCEKGLDHSSVLHAAANIVSGKVVYRF